MQLMVRRYAADTQIHMLTRSRASEEVETEEASIIQNHSMAMGSYIIPAMDWTQDSQLPSRLEDFKQEWLTLFGLDADDNARALQVIQWAGEPGTRQFNDWNIKAQDLKIKTVGEKFIAPTKNFMRASFDLMWMQQRKNEPINMWYQQVQEPCEPPIRNKNIIVTIPYTLNRGGECSQSLMMRVDACADINIMPLSVYQMIFQDPLQKKLLQTSI